MTLMLERMAWPSKGQLDMCFPYGMRAAEAAGDGRGVSLVAEEIAAENGRGAP